MLREPSCPRDQNTNELNPWRLHISSMGRLVCLALPVLRRRRCEDRPGCQQSSPTVTEVDRNLRAEEQAGGGGPGIRQAAASWASPP